MLLELLYQALHSPLGVRVECDDPNRLRQQLYPLRKKHEELKPLSFVESRTNPGGELWIINRSTEDASTE